MTGPVAVDTSVAIPLLVRTHRDHAAVVRWWGGREVTLSGHALPETYSVLTRLPGDLRLLPLDAANLLNARFSKPLVIGSAVARRLSKILAELDISGGAVYDALVALAAREHNVRLATRDLRAKPTYQRVGVSVIVVAAG